MAGAHPYVPQWLATVCCLPLQTNDQGARRWVHLTSRSPGYDPVTTQVPPPLNKITLNGVKFNIKANAWIKAAYYTCATEAHHLIIVVLMAYRTSRTLVCSAGHSRDFVMNFLFLPHLDRGVAHVCPVSGGSLG